MSVLNKFISLLNIWDTGLPLQTQWVCIIHQIPNIITNSVIRQYENVPLASQGDWGTPMDLSSPDLVSGTSQSQDDSGSVTGLFFAQGIILNREFHNTREVTPHSNGPIGGYIPGIVSIGREGFKNNNLVIEIRESNLSFIDHLIRQWIVMGAHLGLVNYGAFGQQYNILNIKSTVEVRQYGKYTKSRHGKGGRPIRKRMIFYNVVPVKFEPFNLTYDAEDLNKNIKSVEFTYSHYSILPPQDTINNIANLNGPTALDNQISALIDLNNVDAIASKYNSAVAQAQSQVTQQRKIALAQLEKLRFWSFDVTAREKHADFDNFGAAPRKKLFPDDYLPGTKPPPTAKPAADDYLPGTKPPPTAKPAADESFGDANHPGNNVIASTFADPDDLSAFARAKERGMTDKQAFKYGDNGIGMWGDDTTADAPMVALPREDWAHLGAAARGAKVEVTANGKTIIAELRDTMPAKKYITNGAGIDLNPHAAKQLGVSIPGKAPVTWRWADTPPTSK